MTQFARHNPDILTCLANLSADEVFTPPKLATAMLDLLPQDLFKCPDTTFLDPVCKSGVFLREIAKRLNDGLMEQMPDEQARIDRQVRDILVEVKEKNTGSVNFGVGVGTDSGVFGSVSLSQRNFDVADVPESFDEFVGGRAFRGAGQGFNVAASPGNEVSLYTISLSEPHLFESDISGRASGFYRDRFYESYKENRYGVGGSFGRRLGDLWSVSVDLNYEHVYLDDFSSGTAIEVYDDRGPSDLFSVGGRLVRTDTDNPMRPTRGSQLELAVSQYMDATNGEPFRTARPRPRVRPAAQPSRAVWR